MAPIPQFCYLPCELQIMIWDFAIVSVPSRTFELETTGNISLSGRLSVPSPCHVCTLSRLRALQTPQKLLNRWSRWSYHHPTRNKTFIILFDWKTDTIFFPTRPGPLRRSSYQKLHFLAYSFSSRASNLSRLAIPFRDALILSRIILHSSLDFRARFENLDVLQVVVRDETERQAATLGSGLKVRRVDDSVAEASQESPYLREWRLNLRRIASDARLAPLIHQNIELYSVYGDVVNELGVQGRTPSN